MRPTPLSVLVISAALVLGACGGDDDPDAGATDTTATTGTTGDATTGGDATTDGEAPADAVTVATADTDLGVVLVDGEGRTLYLFDNDTGSESTCEGDCAQNWPPLTGTASAGGDADASLLGTTARSDGATQVTYAGHPLYYFAGDSEPGQTNGQGVGDIWWVVAPDGAKVTGDAAAEDAAAGGGEVDYGD